MWHRVLLMPVDVFISYSHRDEELYEELAKHLKPLERQGVIRPWHDRKIAAGEAFDAMIDAELNHAGIILSLISPDFINSEYCWGIEMKRAMDRHQSGAARVVPIILRPVDWIDIPFGKIAALPKDGKPVTTWQNRDEALLDIARGIRGVVTASAYPALETVPARASHEQAEASSHSSRGSPSEPVCGNGATVCIARKYQVMDILRSYRVLIDGAVAGELRMRKQYPWEPTKKYPCLNRRSRFEFVRASRG